jgi:AP endonuclease-2
VSKLPKLEAKYVYRLSNSDISTMFSMSKKRTALSSSSESASPSPSSQEGEQSRKITKRSEPSSSKPSPALKSGGGLKTTKSQNKNSIANFFKANKKTTPELVEHEEKPIPFELLDDSKPIHNPEGSKITISNGRFKIGSETIPKCKHNEPCVLKASRKPTTKGKKFWSCGRPPGDPSTNDKYDCGFFQWK